MLNIAKLFALSEEPISAENYGKGHINATYLVTTPGARYILQRINNSIFTDVDGLMDNIQKVTGYLAERDSDPRHVLRVIPTKCGKPYAMVDGKPWRMYNYIEDNICLQSVENPDDFETAARAFGDFMNRLADFPAATLAETIKRFHDTPNRYTNFKNAINADKAGRLNNVRAEVEFALAREADAAVMVNMVNSGELPLRVTHNDTKLNNILLDAKTREPLCVIDLDTVMPGLAGNDFGDAIRFGASTAAEDEKDLSKVNFSLDLFEYYVRGYLGACRECLTDAEKDTLPMGAKLMTLECGVRFLTDYLEGDVYFHTDYPDHNLDRCRTQFKLVADMESKWSEMAKIIDKYK